MLVLTRKEGEGITVTNANTGEQLWIVLDKLMPARVTVTTSIPVYIIGHGQTITHQSGDDFVMVSALNRHKKFAGHYRIGISAPDHWSILRDELITRST